MSEKLLDPNRARKLFEESGASVAEWARVQGFSCVLVYQVLDGRRKCLRGQSHRIALALGLKQGVETDMDALSKQLRAGVNPKQKN
ncbi:MAG: DNA-binding protein [Sulfuritalea sp.]|nr:DNA-binding protein [Sulfuritalea sp.]MDP1982127.1 DNA-binding protein [Sulfuritalea sp.]